MHRVDDVRKVHTIVACEERKREENYCDDGEYHDSFVLRVRDDGELVLLNRAELEELGSISIYDTRL